KVETSSYSAEFGQKEEPEIAVDDRLRVGFENGEADEKSNAAPEPEAAKTQTTEVVEVAASAPERQTTPSTLSDHLEEYNSLQKDNRDFDNRPTLSAKKSLALGVVGGVDGGVGRSGSAGYGYAAAGYGYGKAGYRDGGLGSNTGYFDNLFPILGPTVERAGDPEWPSDVLELVKKIDRRRLIESSENGFRIAINHEFKDYRGRLYYRSEYESLLSAEDWCVISGHTQGGDFAINW